MAKPQYGLVGTKPRKTGIPKVVGPITAQVKMPTGFNEWATARTAALNAAKPPANPYDAYYKMVVGSLQSPAQIEAQARRTALYNERAQLAASKAESDRIIAQYRGQSAQAQGFAKALAQLQGGEDEQAFARYSDAASRLGGLGAGLTGAVADAYQGDVDQATEAIARLTGGAGQVSGVPTADAVRNASNFMGVTVPAGSLQADAVNAARMAQSDAASRAQNIAQIAKGYDARTNAAIADEARDARTIIAGRGSAIQQAIDSLTGNRSNVLNTLGSVVGAKAGWAQQQIENQAALRKEQADALQRVVENARADEQLGITKDYLLNTQTQTAANLTGLIPGTNIPTYAASQDATENAQADTRNAASWTRTNHYESKADGTPKLKNGKLVPVAGYKLAPDGQSVVPIVKGGKAGTGGLTASGWQSLVKDVTSSIGEGLSQARPAGKLYKPQDPNADDQGFIADPNKPAIAPVSYADALRAAITAGPNTAKWRAKAKQLVDANPGYAPGRNGRPWTAATAKAAAISTAKKAYADGLHEDELVTALVNVGIPAKVIRNAVHSIYYMPARSPINGIPPTAEDYPGYKPKE